MGNLFKNNTTRDQDPKQPFLSDLSRDWTGPVETPNGIACEKQAGKWKAGDEGNRGDGDGKINRKEWAGNRSGE